MHSFIVCTRATGRGCLVRKGFPKPNFKIAIQPPNTHVKKKKKRPTIGPAEGWGPEVARSSPGGEPEQMKGQCASHRGHLSAGPGLMSTPN